MINESSCKIINLNRKAGFRNIYLHGIRESLNKRLTLLGKITLVVVRYQVAVEFLLDISWSNLHTVPLNTDTQCFWKPLILQHTAEVNFACSKQIYTRRTGHRGNTNNINYTLWLPKNNVTFKYPKHARLKRHVFAEVAPQNDLPVSKFLIFKGSHGSENFILNNVFRKYNL